MKAMILAAGFGTRLKPITLTLPKPLVPIMNIPVIDYNIHLLLQAGIQEVAVNLHHLGSQIEQYLIKKWSQKIEFCFFYEDPILGTGGGVKNAQSFLKNDPFILINADIICFQNLQKMVQFHKKQNAIATMAVRTLDPSQTYTSLEIRKEKLISFDPKPFPSDLTPFHFACIHILEPTIFDYLPANQASSIISSAYIPYLKENLPIACYPISGFWSDVGTLQEFHATNLYLLKHPELFSNILPYKPRPQDPLPSDLSLGSNVIIGENCNFPKNHQLKNCVMLDNVDLRDIRESETSNCIGFNKQLIKV